MTRRRGRRLQLATVAVAVAVMVLTIPDVQTLHHPNAAAAWETPVQPDRLSEADPLHQPLEEILDLNVRDGFVYYRALQGDRGRLDRYVASLNEPAVAAAYPGWPRERQIAFWLNAYNAFVLQTVVSRYPIRGRAPNYPAESIRQIPGVDQMRFQAAGRPVTLDQIETDILAAFRDPRVFLALGRGAAGSGRLRSEAFSAARLEQQLTEAATEFATNARFIRIDPLEGQVSVNPILSWRQEAFIAAYADRAMNLPGRTPIERAVLGLIGPHLRPAERAFLEKNTFQLRYQDFDWRLNDLTGGRIGG